MPIYITQGRYTREAIKGMIVRPEDRADAVSRLLSKAGARMISLYFTFGEYDFLLIAEAQSETQIAAALLTAASGGGVTGLRTTLAHDHDRGQRRICSSRRSGAVLSGPRRDLIRWLLLGSALLVAGGLRGGRACFSRVQGIDADAKRWSG